MAEIRKAVAVNVPPRNPEQATKYITSLFKSTPTFIISVEKENAFFTLTLLLSILTSASTGFFRSDIRKSSPRDSGFHALVKRRYSTTDLLSARYYRRRTYSSLFYRADLSLPRGVRNWFFPSALSAPKTNPKPTDVPTPTRNGCSMAHGQRLSSSGPWKKGTRSQKYTRY